MTDESLHLLLALGTAAEGTTGRMLRAMDIGVPDLDGFGELINLGLVQPNGPGLVLLTSFGTRAFQQATRDAEAASQRPARARRPMTLRGRQRPGARG